MDFHLAGMTAIVTGASKGIGLAITEALVGQGCRVVAGARTPSPALREITPFVFEVDLSTSDGPGKLVDYARSQVGGLDLLVNNVGGNPAPFAGFLSIDDDAWQRTFDITLLSAVRTTRAALPSLLERGGAIINIGSVNASLPLPNLVAYSAAKAALLNLSKALAEEFGPRGVRVNTISPGPTRTGVWTAPGGTGAALAQSLDMPHTDLVDQIPTITGLSTGRITEPSEIAALVLFLASDLTPNVSGAQVTIDGGMIKTV